MKGDFTRFTFDPKKRYTNVLKQQGRVDLDADWNEQSAIDTYLDRISRMDLSGMENGAPSLKPGFEVTVAPGGKHLNISAGRFYAKGIICELFQAIRLRFTPVPAVGRTDSVYLDVWQRHITAIEDPSIKEIALGGPDTTTRVQTIFQIRINESVGAVDCSTAPLPAPSGAQMTSSLVPVPPEDDLCLIGATGGYRGLENRLYRVEIHTPGALGTATFKWSRDNGSVVFPISEFVTGQPTKIRVTRLGRDQVLSLHEGDWVEVLDDDIELGGTTGTIAKIQNIDPANRELTLSVAVSGSMTAHPKARRWDQKSAPIATSATPIPLEDGIQVSFGGSNFKTGDFWMFAARATDGTIETLTNQPAQGIDHVYAQLAIVTWASSTTATVHDCRNIFPSPGGGDCCCTVVVQPGESIQKAIDSLTADGGCVCLKVGDHPITEPIRILKSHVILHGESTGARVISGTSRKLLLIGDPTGKGVDNVAIHDIQFVTNGGPADDKNPEQDAIIGVFRSKSVHIYDCSITSMERMIVTGVVMIFSERLRIDRNEIAGVMIGVQTIDDCQFIEVLDNSIEGIFTNDGDFGLTGVMLLELMGACSVMRNRIQGFAEGIRLQESDAEGRNSFVTGNRIVRLAPVVKDPGPFWGVGIDAFGCLVGDNTIELADPRHGGIRAHGARTRIEGNDVISTVVKSVPVGIRLEGGGTTEDGVIRGNRLVGNQSAIVVRGCRGVEVLDNDIRVEQLEGQSLNGILLEKTVDTLVSANRISGAERGITTLGGTRERIMSNHVGSGGHGILAERGLALMVADNLIEDMRTFGVAASRMDNTTTITRNRVVRCATVAEQAATAAIVVVDTLGEVVIELNDILDTGIKSGKLVGAVDGVHVITPRSRIQSNHVTYTDPALLNRKFECRSLRLEGQKSNTNLADAPNAWALVLDNSFIGVGFSALVEIMGQAPLDRLTFGNNYCEHYSVGDGGATVSLLANHAIVQGNQVKAERNFVSFNFNKMKSVIFAGNISTSGAVQLPSPLPTPTAAFNLVV